ERGTVRLSKIEDAPNPPKRTISSSRISEPTSSASRESWCTTIRPSGVQQQSQRNDDHFFPHAIKKCCVRKMMAPLEIAGVAMQLSSSELAAASWNLAPALKTRTSPCSEVQ